MMPKDTERLIRDLNKRLGKKNRTINTLLSIAERVYEHEIEQMEKRQS